MPIPNLPSPSRYTSWTFTHNVLRDQFSISTWLLLGASLQCLFLYLPIRAPYIQSLALLLLAAKLLATFITALGWKKNGKMNGTIVGKVRAGFPASPHSSDTGGEEGEEGDEHDYEKGSKATIVLLGFRSNHPLGLFAPAATTINNFFTSMLEDLEAHAPGNGYLGATPYLDAGARTTSSTIMTNFYFRSAGDVDAWAHGPVHQKGWDWWNEFVQRHSYLCVVHEVYEAPVGKWKNVYICAQPMGFAATNHRIDGVQGDGGEEEKGVDGRWAREGWVSPIRDVGKGIYGKAYMV